MGNFLSFLCLRRGVSPLTTSAETLDDFSLPTQRCFHFADPENWGQILFSAYAEVFPTREQAKIVFGAFLCLRRGVSPRRPPAKRLKSFSLPTQRCFQFHRLLPARTTLFSAYAEVFLPSTSPPIITRTFLCLRRGVSDWGIGRVRRDWLFSAYAEVFPPPHGYRESPSPFLCLRRGVSCLTNVRFC